MADFRSLVWPASVAALVMVLVPALAMAQDESSPAPTNEELTDSPDLTYASEDGDFSVTVGADLQLRYELVGSAGEAQSSSIFIRRLRPMLEGRAFEKLSFRVIPEMAREASLRDGWVAYEVLPGHTVQAGQFAPPFNWERDGSSDYHQFVERSAANDAFQWVSGRDIGVMVDSEFGDFLHLETGFFNGQGRNAADSPTTGHLATGRLASALVGSYHEIEAMVTPAQELTMIAGVGGYYAFNNLADDWGRWEDGDDAETLDHRGNIASGTADLHLTWWRLSAQVAGFYRDVRAAVGGTASFEDYQGWGMTAQAGALLVDRRLLLVLRHSQARPNLDNAAESVDEYNVGLQIFMQGHHSKFHVQAGYYDLRDPAAEGDEWVGRLQYQLLF